MNKISVTSLINSLFPEFDPDKVAKEIHARNPVGQYAADLSAEKTRQRWADQARIAAEKGTKMHEDIKNFFNPSLEQMAVKEYLPHPGISELVMEYCREDSVEFKQFLQFHQDIIRAGGYKILQTEWKVSDPHIPLFGLIDAVFATGNTDSVSSAKEVILVDWKRSKNIVHSNSSTLFAKKGMFPCVADLDDCNYNHYSLQMNLLKYLVEKNYGLKVVGMMLGVFHPESPAYRVYKICDMPYNVTAILNHLTTASANIG